MDTIAGISDDQCCRQTDRLVAELSSTLCALEQGDLGSVIDTMLKRIGELVGVDRATLVEYADEGHIAQAYQWSGSSTESDQDVSEAASPAWLWDRLGLDRETLTFERIPGDLPTQILTPDVLEYLQHVPLQSAVVVPVMIGGERACALALETVRNYRMWPTPLVERLRLFTELLAGAVHRRRQDLVLSQSKSDLARLTGQLVRDSEASGGHEAPPPQVSATFNEIVGQSASLRGALSRVDEVAPTTSSVLLLGETGTGKELFARAIHLHGPRKSNPFVIVNCAALPPTLIESELFGHARGAFTGAVATRQGRFELAHRGTLFLDEIGDLPLDLQTKMLRVLQEGSFERLGSSQTQKVDVRIIAATHRDLSKMVADGSFRDDLYYRLSVFPIRLPALRERREDIPTLVWFIIQKRQQAMHRWIKRVPDNVMDALQHHTWPGNIRELENVIERALIHTTGDTLKLLDETFEPPPDHSTPHDDTTLTAVERAHIQEVLRACGWRINGAGNAAERLGLHPNTLRFRMKKLGIVRDSSRTSTGGMIASA